MRDFLYLDSRLVDQYLAQVEGGLYDEEQERSLGGSIHGTEGGVPMVFVKRRLGFSVGRGFRREASRTARRSVVGRGR
ncbi:DUF6414 family protein [Calidifontibacter indicus]